MGGLDKTFSFYRDLRSIAFIRCISKIPGTEVFAEGTSFSLLTAREKCRSELAERIFHRSLPATEKKVLLGIAAHPSSSEADRHAWNEALEALFLQRIAEGHKLKAISIGKNEGMRLTISRFGQAWLALFRFPHAGTFAIVQAVSNSMCGSVLKAWSEVRNVKIYNPTAAELPRYTKGNRILFDRLDFRLSFGLLNEPIDRASYSTVRHKLSSHHVTYIKKDSQ